MGGLGSPGSIFMLLCTGIVVTILFILVYADQTNPVVHEFIEGLLNGTIKLDFL